MEINHALIAIIESNQEVDVLHFCGFKEKPNFDDVLAFEDRLSNDPQYGLVNNSKYTITEASYSMIEYYKNLNPPDEDAYYFENGKVAKM